MKTVFALTRKPTAWLLAALILLMMTTLVVTSGVASAQTKPLAPAWITAARSGGEIQVEWAAADGADKYHIAYTVNGWHWEDVATAHTGTSVSIDENIAKREYVVRIRSGNDAGWSWWKKAATIPRLTGGSGGGGIAVGAPGKTISAPDAPSSVTVVQSGSSITASWPAAANAVLYAVEYSAQGGSWAPAHKGVDGTSITINGVDASGTYLVRVKSRGYGGVSGWTISTIAGPRSTPGAFTASIDLNSIFRRWIAPAPSIHFTEITQTTARLNVAHNNATWSWKEGTGGCSSAQDSSTSSVSLTGLAADAAYEYQAWTNGTCSGASFARETLKTPSRAAALMTVGSITSTFDTWFYRPTSD